MSFESPWFFLLFLLFPAIAYWRRRHRFSTPLLLPNAVQFSALESRGYGRVRRLLKGIFWLGMLVMVIALARPSQVILHRDHQHIGVDMVLLIDVSQSMNAEDFKPRNRLWVAKEKMQEFVKNRDSDRIGLVVFGGSAFTLSPLTFDHVFVNQRISELQLGQAGDGTAIGDAIAIGVHRLQRSPAKSRVMILLTDGENNVGQLDPMTAATLAASLGIKIYTIGVGRAGGAPFKVYDPTYGNIYARNPDGSPLLAQVDEGTLRAIAQHTGGAYFRAQDGDSLSKIYRTIDGLEKSKLRAPSYRDYVDWYALFLWAGFACVLAAFALGRWLQIRVI